MSILMEAIQKGELVFVRLLLPLIIGIVAGFFLPPSPLLYQFALGLSIFLLIYLWISVAFYNRFKIYYTRWKPGFAVKLSLVTVGIALTLFKSEKLNNTHFSKFENDALVVTINSEPKLTGDILRFTAEVKQGLIADKFRPQSGLLSIALKLKNEKHFFEYGDELLITGLYTEVDPPFNPFEFDYKQFLKYHEIYHQAFINESQIRVLSRDKGNWIVNYALHLRRSLVLKIDHYISDKEAASVASTLILGYKAELSREVLSAYSKTGTMHVLSVSGMHVGIVFFILSKILWFMSRTKNLRILRAVIIISLIWFYALITGFSPSVCRAALMLSFYVLGKAVNRSSNSYNLVAMSAVFLLLYNPYFLFDVGFQLSYLAVLGLIYFYPKIYNLFYVKNWLLDKIWGYLALSFAAQLATFPLGMYYFHQFPVYFLLSNLFIVIPVIVIMYLGILFLFVPWDVVLRPAGLLLNQGITFMNKGLFFIESLPQATYSSYFGFEYYLLIYLIIAGLMLSVQNKSKAMLYASLAIICVFLSYQSAHAIAASQQNCITFYSLRKNTAFSFFNGENAFVYSDLDSADKTLAYSVHSFVQANSGQSYYFKLNHQSDNMVFSDGNFFKFKGWKLLVWDKGMNDKTYNNKVRVNALLLSGNPKIEIIDLLKVVEFDKLLIDGSNPDYKIKKWVTESKNLSLNFYVLKKNPAYIISLNH